jgi:hypothetical protein
MLKRERGEMVDVMEKAEIARERPTIGPDAWGTFAEEGVSARDKRICGPGGEGGKGLLERERPVGIGEMGSIVVGHSTSACSLPGKSATWFEWPWIKREELVLRSQSKEPTEIVLRISDGVGAFALSDKRGFDEPIE